MTILTSSHLLGEIDKMVSHVGIIYKGRMLFQGPLAELHGFQQRGSHKLIRTSDNEAACRLLHEHEPEMSAEGVSIAFDNDGQVAAINRQLTRHNLDVYLLSSKESDLEQLFIDLTSANS